MSGSGGEGRRIRRNAELYLGDTVRVADRLYLKKSYLLEMKKFFYLREMITQLGFTGEKV